MIRFDMEEARRKFALWIIRQVRLCRLHRSEVERLDQARHFTKYEFVGGPYDGQTRRQNPHLSHYVGRGVYELDGDGRFHYQQLAPSWFDRKAE